MPDFQDLVYKFRVHLVLLSIQLCFSGWHVIGSVALQTADPLVFSMYREVTASLLMLGVVWYNGFDNIVAIEQEDYVRFVFLGFCSFVNVLGTLFALQLIPATRYSVMQPTIPVFATVVSVLIGLERLTVYKSVGIALAVGGAMTIELWKSEAQGDDDEFDAASLTLGMILVSVQCLGMACLLVFQQPMVRKYDTAFVTLVYYSIGTLITLIMAAAWFQRFTAPDFYFNGNLLPVVALLYAAVFATLYAYNAYAWAGRRVDPSISAIYCTVQPVGTALLSLIIFGDQPTPAELVGGVLVALGLVTTVRGKVLEQQAQAKARYAKLGGEGESDEDGSLPADAISSQALSTGRGQNDSAVHNVIR